MRQHIQQIFRHLNYRGPGVSRLRIHVCYPCGPQVPPTPPTPKPLLPICVFSNQCQMLLFFFSVLEDTAARSGRKRLPFLFFSPLPLPSTTFRIRSPYNCQRFYVSQSAVGGRRRANWLQLRGICLEAVGCEILHAYGLFFCHFFIGVQLQCVCVGWGGDNPSLN